MLWEFLHPQARPEMLGFLPMMLAPEDPRSAKEQFDANYQHGGGWRNQPGFTKVTPDEVIYPGDPPFYPIAKTWLRDEQIVLFEHEYVGIFQPDGSYEICRMD